MGSLPGCCCTKERGTIASEEDGVQQRVLGGHVRSPDVRGDSSAKIVDKSCLLDEEVSESDNSGGSVRGNKDKVITNENNLVTENNNNDDNVPNSFDDFEIVNSISQNEDCETLGHARDDREKGCFSVTRTENVKAIHIYNDDDVDPNFP